MILLVLFFARTALAFQFQTVATVGPRLIDQFGIDFTTLGTLIGLYLLPGAVFAIPSGLIGQRFGDKRVLLIGLLLMAVGGALTALDSLTWLFVGRLISGIGGVLLNVIATKLLADWFAGHETVVAMSVFVASWPFGVAFGLVLFPPVENAWGWPGVMLLAALVALIAAGMIALLYRHPPEPAAADPVGLRTSLTSSEWMLIIAAGSIWGLFNSGYIVLVSFAPELFVARGFTPARAASIVSVLGWALIVMVPLFGSLAQRWRRPNLQMTLGFVAIASATALLPFTSAPVAAFLFLALIYGMPAGLIMTLPPQAVVPHRRALGMGAFYALYYAFVAILPSVAGRVRDISGTPAAPSLFAAATVLLSVLMLALFRVVQRWPKAT